MKKTTLLLALPLFGVAHAADFTANFDTFAEGTFAPTMSDGGIDFYNLDRNIPGGGDVFTIEASNSGDLGPAFSAPNVLGFGGYVPGNGTAFGRLKSFEFSLSSPGSEMQTGELDFWTFMLSQSGNTVHFEGWMGGLMMDEQTWNPSSFVIDHVHFSLSGGYDRFVVRSDGPIDNGVVFANVDNVHVTAEAVPEPATLTALGVGAIALLRRRRR